jgi:hypothetical protein
MGVQTPLEEGAKATLRRIMDTGAEESGMFLNIRVDGWEKLALVACRT